MKEYKRLTKRTDLGCAYCEEPLFYSINRLAELEDKIEQGRMIEFSCKVATTLYFIYNRPHADKPVLEPKICETDKWYFDIDKNGIAICVRESVPYGYNGEYFYYLNETVFLTKAEAEQKLKEIKDER